MDVVIVVRAPRRMTVKFQLGLHSKRAWSLQRNVRSIVGEAAPAAHRSLGRLLRGILVPEPRPHLFGHGVERGQRSLIASWIGTTPSLVPNRCPVSLFA